jgi:hypothetical protein
MMPTAMMPTDPYKNDGPAPYRALVIVVMMMMVVVSSWHSISITMQHIGQRIRH